MWLPNEEHWGEPDKPLEGWEKQIIKREHSDKTREREEQRLLGYNYEYARASIENGEPEKAEKAFRSLLKTNGSFIPAYLASPR